MNKYKKFSNQLESWYTENARHTLTCRKTHDPYRILVSEVMLQQTQVSRVIKKYAEFLKKFPTLRSLALAPQKDILQVWDGLGYFHRARNLHATAKEIMKNHKGKLPLSPQNLIHLPGIGDYTAGAVACFATDTFYPFYDINIRRALIHELKVTDEKTALHQALTKSFAQSSLSPSDFYYALFDYGSFLKGKDTQKVVSKKQSKFKGSFRSFRSFLLKRIISNGPMKKSIAIDLLETELRSAESDFSPESVIESLKKAQLLQEKKSLLFIS